MERAKAVDKAAKLKLHMESAAKMGSEEEAQAFAAMMQRLMLEHALNEAEVERAGEASMKSEPVIELMVDFLKYSVQLKKVRVAWNERLARLVGEAHLCRFLLRKKSNQIWFVGTQKHAEVAEYMWCNLVNSVAHMSDKAAYFYKLRAVREGHGQSAANGFRSAWIDSFVNRLGERYQNELARTAEEHDAALKQSGVDEGTGSSLMIIKNAMNRVEDYIDGKFRGMRGAKPVYGRRHTGIGSIAGGVAGRVAANDIALSPRKGISS